MPFLYILLGVTLVLIYHYISRPIKRAIVKVKATRKKGYISEVQQLREDYNILHKTVKELQTDMKLLHQLTSETQKNNVLLFPERFEEDKAEGKTIFVKDGEEKPYDTIDWRSR